MRVLTFLILFVLSTQVVFAAVLEQSSHGFTIQIEKEVSANAVQTYQQFLKVAEWWNADHTYFGQSKNLLIEPHAGGCFCEIDGDKQVLHMTVTYVEPNKKIHMTGGLGPLQMMGVHGGMIWEFISIGKNRTKIIHRYQVSGYSKNGLDQIAPVVDKVQSLQVDSLANKLVNKD